MTNTGTAADGDASPAAKQHKRVCFIVMPMSDGEGERYPSGHWDCVYDELFTPACEKAKFVPERADSKKSTALIMSDVLRKLHKADMVLCDMSALRPNVMFELGLRQAFDQPVVLVHDERTTRPFDLAALRDLSYDSSLRIDLVRRSVEAVATALNDTYENRDTGEHSLVRLLDIAKAEIPKPASEDAVQRSILAALERLSSEVQNIRLQALLPVTATYPFVAGNYSATASNPGAPSGLLSPGTYDQLANMLAMREADNKKT